MGLKDFILEKKIGKGAFGEVFLARKIPRKSMRSKGGETESSDDPKEVYALKKIKKSLLIEKNQIESILVEKEVLKGTRSPWIVHLFYSFHDIDYLYLGKKKTYEYFFGYFLFYFSFL